MPSPWLTAISWVALGVAFLSTALILYDLFARGYRQHMWIMEAVRPRTALSFGPLVLWAYRRWGRTQSPRWAKERGEALKKSFAASVAVGDSHCGADCTLGDAVGSPTVVYMLGCKIFVPFLFAEYVVDYLLAYPFGIAFQYYSIKPRMGLSVGERIGQAIKAAM